MTVDPIPLHLAENIEKLDELTKDTRLKSQTKLDGLCKAADRLFETASSSNNQRDEEKQYIYYNRFVKLVNDIATWHNDRNFTDSRFGIQVKRADDRITLLKASLIKRYAAKNESVVNTVQPEKSKSAEGDKPFEFSAQFISPEELYQAYGKGVKLIIWDARTAEEYATSKIKEFNNINIPAAIIKNGYSANVLGRKIPPEYATEYNNRGEYCFIILMDWRTTESTFAMSTLQVLYNIITMWDIAVYKNKPHILEGGYLAWLDKYPTFSTNSAVYMQNYYEDLDDLLSLDDIIYPSNEKPDEKMQVDEDTMTVGYPDEDEDMTPAHSKENDVQDIMHVSKLMDSFESLIDQESELLSLYKDLEIIITGTHGHDNPEEEYLYVKNNINRIFAETKEMAKECESAYDAILPRTSNPQIIERLNDLQIIYKDMQMQRKSLSDRLDDVEVKSSSPEKVEKPEGPIGDSKAGPSRPEINRNLKPGPSKGVQVIPIIDRKTKPLTREIKFTDLLVDDRNTIHKGLTGLFNIHNTCYQNSLIQCLRHIPLVAIYILKEVYLRDADERRAKIIRDFGYVVQKLWFTTENYIRTQELFEKYAQHLDSIYGKGSHEDIHQFFLSLVLVLVEDTKRKLPVNNNASPAVKYLYSQLDWCTSFFSENLFHQFLTLRECVQCHQRSIRYDMENVFMLSIPEHMENRPFRLQDLMKIYLDGEAPRRQICKKCKIPTRQERKLVKYPKIAIICIKRYKFLGNNTWEKNEQSCEFYENLRIENVDYKLHSIALHIGTMTKGHYTAVCLNPVDNKWYEFNDTAVNVISNLNNQDLCRKAYLLFYESLSNNLNAD